MAQLQYSPLDESAFEIRLLTLLPGEFGKQLRGTIDVAVLTDDHVPLYEALSYTWGSSENFDSITLGRVNFAAKPSAWRSMWAMVRHEDYKLLAITHNLSIALQHLRKLDESRVFWIDAICVDQSNVHERTQQVERMADVYTLAHRATVWLGPRANDSNSAMKVLRRLGSGVAIDWSISQIIADTDENADETMNLPLSETAWRSGFFLSRPWFQRLWIWQEVHLAKNRVDMTRGRRSIEWEKFRNAIKYLRIRTNMDNVAKQDLLGMIENICDYTQVHDDISYVLSQARLSKCSDQRDRLFAVQNLVAPAQRFALEPDYSMSTIDVYTKLVVTTVEHDISLWPLTMCELGNTSLALPSWVPGCSHPPRYFRSRRQTSC